jgi:predicted ATP-grasp superfamily ATP-dependent carboligase
MRIAEPDVGSPGVSNHYARINSASNRREVEPVSITTAPRIAIVYEPDSVPLLAFAALAARRVVDPVWITDDVNTRVLRRLGTVVEVGGRSVDELADELVQLGLAGITTFADAQIERTAAIAARTGLPGNSEQTARRLVDKIAQREALAEAGLPGPEFVGMRSHVDVAERSRDLDGLRYPVVVKPAFGFGGRDTFLERDAAGVRARLGVRADTQPWEATIVEECLGDYPSPTRDGFGDYVSVEVVVAQGSPRIVTVTGRMPLAEPFRETGAFLPPTLSRHDQSEVSDMTAHAVRALDVRHGCLHVEIKLTAQGPRVIEVNGRLAGGGIPDLVAAFTGVNLFESAMCCAMGRHVETKPVAGHGVHYDVALQPPIGRRARLKADWSPQLRGIPGLEHVTLRTTEAKVGPCDGSYGYLLMASGVAADHRALLDTYRQMYALMDVE